MHQHARARGVSQEGEPEPRADRCSFDQPWKIGDRRSTTIIDAKFEYAEVRLKGGEGVVANLRLCRRECGEERGLPSVRQPNKAHVSDQA